MIWQSVSTRRGQRCTWQRRGVSALMVSLVGVVAASVHAQRVLDDIPQTEGVGLTMKIGEVLPLETPFKDAQNNDVQLQQAFDGERPVLLLFVYFDCPLQCPFTMQQAQNVVNELQDQYSWTAGEQYRLLVMSFDHNDTPRTAKLQRDAFLLGLNFEPLEGGIEFWTGDAKNIRALADAAGFYYTYLPEIDEFSHVSSLIYVQPDGTVHNYMKGFPFPTPQVRLGLLEASAGSQGTVFEQVLQFCYSWSDSEGKYTLQAKRVMQLAGGVTLVAVSGLLGGLFLTGRVRNGQRRAVSGTEKASETMTNPTKVGR